MRRFFGLFFVFVPIGLVFLNSCLSGVGAPPSGTQDSLIYLIFAVPLLLGIYLLSGASRLSKRAHVAFGFIGAFLLSAAAGTAWNKPFEFDVDIVIYYLVIFGAVYFGTLTAGYINSQGKPNVGLRRELENRDQDDPFR